MPIINTPRGGINTRVPAYKDDLAEKNQCVTMQNMRWVDDIIETIPGTRRYHGNSLGSFPVSAIMPYYNDQTDLYRLLAACGGVIYKRNEETNEFETLASGFTPTSIFSSTIRHSVMFIAMTSDKLKQYTGGNKIETVGGGTTAPGSFRIIIYMKEIDRLFGISDNAIFGQIAWCNLSQPEIWDGDNLERIKLKDGERVEGAEILYGKLVIFCTYSIWIYYVSGNEENWKLEEAPTHIGCVAPNTIKKDGSRILFLGDSPARSLGVYSFNGSVSTLLTDDITPTLKDANKNKLRNACAEIHDDLYTLSLTLGGAELNNYSIDLDLVNQKEDGTPAIYGPHTFGFFSSSVLNNRQKNKEFLMGSQEGGFVRFQNGTTFDSTNGINGTAITSDFLSRIHNDEEPNIMKQYSDLSIFFQPTSFFAAKVRAYLSYGTFSEETTWNPAVVSDSFAGEYDVNFQRILSVPSLYEFKKYMEMSARGTSIQVGITSSIAAQRLAFSNYGYNFSKLYKTERPQAYVTNS